MQNREDHEGISEEWQRLCSWLRAKANQAIAKSNDELKKRSIEIEVASFCRDRPPTKSLLSAWQTLFNEAAASWETGRALDELLRKARSYFDAEESVLDAVVARIDAEHAVDRGAIERRDRSSLAAIAFGDLARHQDSPARGPIPCAPGVLRRV